MILFENNEDWIEKLTKQIIGKFWNTKKYEIKRKNTISSIFLAWAPWSWKTEFLDTIFCDLKKTFIIIDIDKYREKFKWYNWENSSEFQNASVKVADKILKYCFQNNLNFVFDGTFRNYNKVKQNFWQCEKYNRKSLITLIFQEPRISFYYTFLRKINKKRNVPIEVFVDWFYNSIYNVFKVINSNSDVDLIIAHKRYNTLDKDTSYFDINNKIRTLQEFCTYYKILYKHWEFKNKENLKLDIEKYNNILERQFLWKWPRFLRFKMWLYEKFWKLF